MSTIKPRINRRSCALLVTFLHLIYLIGCADRLAIDKVPSGTPKGFVEFYLFPGCGYPKDRKEIRIGKRFDKDGGMV